MLDLDIEKIADGVKPKQTLTPEYFGSSNPLKDEIFAARDIKTLTERHIYLSNLIATERNYEIEPQYGEPLFKEFFINGKRVNLNIPEKIRILPDQLLISQCETELKIVEDLLYLTQMAKEYFETQGTNKRYLYLFYAKEGYIKNQYRKPLYYSESEYVQIVEMIASAINQLPPEEATQKAIDIENTPIPKAEIIVAPVAKSTSFTAPKKSTNKVSMRSIALYYYYLSLYDRTQPLTKNNATAIAENYGFMSPNSGKDLFDNHFRKVVQDDQERVSVGQSRKSDQARLNNLRAAVAMLKESSIPAAHLRALEELDAMERKFTLEYGR